MIISDNGGTSFEQPPTGSHAARCISIIDLGTQRSTYEGEVQIKHQVIVRWELANELLTIGDFAGKPFTVSKFYTASLHEKAGLRKDLASWRGRDFTAEELKGFDMKSILGKPCMLSVGLSEKGKAKVLELNGKKCEQRSVDRYEDYRRVLDRKDIVVVTVVTPDHWHSKIAIEALKAGKDVYCEKPLTHWSQFEIAKEVQQVSDETGKLVQVGTQHMADDNYPQIIQLIREGIIGKPVHVQCSYFRRGDWGERMPIPDPNAKPGPDLLWDRFLGDAPQVDFSTSRFFQWRMYLDYAGGPATDLLVHTFTPIFCVLELDYPTRVFGCGGTFQYVR